MKSIWDDEARRFRDGTYGVIDYSGHYQRVDKTGRVLKEYRLNWFNFLK